MVLHWMNKKILLFCSIVLAAYLAIRLINHAQLIWTFPLDINNDLSSYLGQLHLLDVCGFHNQCDYWYNGAYNVLKFYPPAWFFFTLPLYWLTQSVQTAAYLSLILMFVLMLVGFWQLSKAEKLGKYKALTFA